MVGWNEVSENGNYTQRVPHPLGVSLGPFTPCPLQPARSPPPPALFLRTWSSSSSPHLPPAPLHAMSPLGLPTSQIRCLLENERRTLRNCIVHVTASHPDYPNPPDSPSSVATATPLLSKTPRPLVTYIYLLPLGFILDSIQPSQQTLNYFPQLNQIPQPQ